MPQGPLPPPSSRTPRATPEHRTKLVDTEYARRRVCVEKNVRLSNRRQVRAAKKEVFGTATHRQVMSVSTIDAREQMSARACSSAPLSTRESFLDTRLCVRRQARGRAGARAPGAPRGIAQPKARSSRARGPTATRSAVGARTAEAVAGPSSHVWTPPKTFSAPRSLPQG